MAELFLARAETTDGLASYEAFSLINSATNMYLDHGAILALFNEYNSDSVVRIKRIEINELVARTTTTPTKLSLNRITALTGGETISPIKMDSVSADLPSQVSIVKNAGSVTNTGVQYRDQLGFQNLSIAALRGLATPLFGSGMGHNAISAFSNGLLYSLHDANVQGIVLREGQGISLNTSSVAPQNYPLEISFYVNNGSACYLVREVVNRSANPSLMAILNGSGSGVVLTVGRIQITQIKTDDILPMFTVETITGTYEGQDISVVKMDSLNEDIPAGVKVKKNCTVTQVNADASLGGRKKESGDLALRRRASSPFGVSPALASGIIPFMNKRQAVFDFSPTVDTDGGLVLREGEGIAIMQRPNASAWGNYEVLVYFTNVYSPGGGVYPAEGDVEAGVSYGQTGVEYTGTFDVPAEADVLLGVQYGADGVEFEGEATGGGTGLIYIDLE